MRDFTFVAADAVEPAGLHLAFGEAFSDYLIGAFQLPLAQWPYFLSRQCVDLAESRVAMRDGEIAAFAFVAQRPERDARRLATMGSPPAHRGGGAAKRLLDDFVERARAAGCASVELECFAQNERALALYRGRGFAEAFPLYGYSREAAAADAAHVDAADVTIDEAFARIDAIASASTLPLQVTPRVLRTLAAKAQAARSSSAVIVWTQPEADLIMIQCLLDEDSSLQGAESLARHLVSRFGSTHRIHAAQLHRPDLGAAALERAGFSRLPLFQWWMERPLP